MKKLLAIFVCFFLVSGSFANLGLEKSPPNASEILVPIGNTGKKISLMELSRITMKDLQELTGRKMGLMEKLSFKATQRKLRNNINADGTFDKKFEKKMKKWAEVGGFHAGGFFLGLLLGLIGVLIAYLIKDDKKRNRVKWAWIGWAIWVAIWVIILVA